MIVFQNPGLVPLEAVTTMGISVKETDSPIGFFGTGLKFAIATILRGGGNITIHRGLEPFVFGTERDEVRGQPFEFVTMNGQRLGFTTQLGRKWEPWMAFRELASNCLDEGGRHFLADGATSWSVMADYTTITVGGDEIGGVWGERGTVLLESPPLAVSEHAEIHEGPSLFAFYRGVRVMQLSRPSVFTYNLQGALRLTEDRTPAEPWAVEFAIEKSLGALEDQHMLRKALTCGERHYEHHLDVPAYGKPGPAFRAAARELAMGHETVPSANPKAVESARESALDDMEPGVHAALEPHQVVMLDRAKTMLKAGGFDVDEFPVTVCSTLGPNICGAARDGRIFVSLLPFQKGTREVAATLLEEFAHLKSGAADETRAFQNWLFDQLLVQAERAAGVPF